MTKLEKIAALGTAMTTRERTPGDEDTRFFVFADDAPTELQNLFCEHYEVRDIDYETFSRACDIVGEVYGETPEISKDGAEDDAADRADDRASVYTAARLSYINIWNQGEVADIVREYDGQDVADAAAIWYERRVKEAARHVIGWVNKED